MTSFEMIKYHGQEYPADVPLRIEEIAANFDITNVGGKLGRSLHTEYSYGKRKFNSDLIAHYPEICSAQKDGLPQLWKNEAWDFSLLISYLHLSVAGMIRALLKSTRRSMTILTWTAS